MFLKFTKNLTAQSTIATLGMPLSSKHDSFRNKRMLQDGVRAQKKKEAPAGLQWNGTIQIFISSFSLITVDLQV
jgi:hypothetical protein